MLRDHRQSPVVLAGVSLGGNVLLKYLGERADDLPAQIRGAAAISVPFDLERGARFLMTGLSRMYDDDLEQLSAGMLLYDAFFRWCRDATKETHNWPTNKAKP